MEVIFISAKNNSHPFIFLHEDKPTIKFDMEEVFSFRVVNIFSDASTTKLNKQGNRDYGCFGSIVVKENDILDRSCRIDNKCSTNLCELNGLRMSLSYALLYANHFDKINIFSDSLYGVDSLRRFMYSYKFKLKEDHGYLYKRSGDPIDNQSILVECMDMYEALLQLKPNIRLFHQSGHVSLNNYDSIVLAASKFKTINNISTPLDLNIIRYISYYNDYIDNYTRSFLHGSFIRKNYYYPIEFYPTHSY